MTLSHEQTLGFIAATSGLDRNEIETEWANGNLRIFDNVDDFMQYRYLSEKEDLRYMADVLLSETMTTLAKYPSIERYLIDTDKSVARLPDHRIAYLIGDRLFDHKDNIFD